MSKEFKFENISLKENEKIGKKRVRELFNELAKQKEMLSSKECLNFFDKFQSAFKLPSKFKLQRYENEEMALKMWGARPKEVELEVRKYLIEKLGEGEWNYYQFEKGLLIMLDVTNERSLKLTKTLQFRQITLREIDVHKRKYFGKEDQSIPTTNAPKLISPTKSPLKIPNLIPNPKPEKISSITTTIPRTIDTSSPFESPTIPLVKEIIPQITPVENFQLPDQKGLRMTIFGLIFEFLTPSQTLKCGMVCKEWLHLSRADKLWRAFLLRSFVGGNAKKTYPYTELGSNPNMPMPFFARKSTNQKICEYLRNYKIPLDKPLFIEYWRVRDEITNIRVEESKPHPPMSCGIGSLPRDPSLVLDNQPIQQSSSLECSIQPKENQSAVNQVIRDDDEGCCHDSVKLLANSLFDSNSFHFLGSLKMSETELGEWKKSLCKKVSLECMEVAMSDSQIKGRLFELISVKLFGY